MLIRRAIALEESTRAMRIRGPVAIPIALGVLLLLPSRPCRRRTADRFRPADPPSPDTHLFSLPRRRKATRRAAPRREGGCVKGGESGKPAIKPHDPAGSLLMQRITTTDLEKRMPPKDDPPLSREEIALLERWIKEGAKWTEP